MDRWQMSSASPSLRSPQKQNALERIANRNTTYVGQYVVYNIIVYNIFPEFPLLGKPNYAVNSFIYSQSFSPQQFFSWKSM